jgi:hypothetical protein
MVKQIAATRVESRTMTMHTSEAKGDSTAMQATAAQGVTVVAAEADPDRLRQAIDLAFNYRGDVTIIRRSGAAAEGYIFDRRSSLSLDASVVRLMPKDGSPRLTIPYSDIAELRFTGKDTAEGKSFETWVRKYAEKKLKGEQASIESESLE